MTHEEIKESLSAYSDGQLAPDKMTEIAGHLPGCGECTAVLLELKTLSSGIKTNLAPSAPTAMKERLLDKARGVRIPLFRPSTVLAAALTVIILALMAGLAAKRLMPTMYAQIQGMISGAASSLGSGANK